MGYKSEATFLRLLDRLPGTGRYRIDAYGVYGCYPVNTRRIVKSVAVNRNEGLHFVLRGKLNRLVRLTKGYSKTDGMQTLSIALGWLKLGWI